MSAKTRHTQKQDARMRELIKQIGPKTKLAKLTLANWKGEKVAGLTPSADDDSSIVRIPLDKLDESPYQLRHEMDSAALEELTRSIREQGLLNPILVRRVEKGYEVISGHRRLGAYRRLSFAEDRG